MSGAPRNPDVERVANMNLDGASDRARGSAAGSHRGSVVGSQAGSPTRSRRDSQAVSPTRLAHGPTTTTSGKASGFGAKPLGYDPAREKKLSPADIIGKRVDLPADAYLKSSDISRFTPRPGYNDEGKPIQVELNLFPAEFQDRNIYQYDVSIYPAPEKESKALMKKLWNSKPLQDKIKEVGAMWLHDGNKLAWTSKVIDGNGFICSVDLDADKPTKKKVAATGVFEVTARQSAVIKLHYLKQYVEGNISWDTHVLECMNFIDHCMRQSPSEKMVAIKRNFYPMNSRSMALSRAVLVHKGFYAAARLSTRLPSPAAPARIMINVDTANTAFWQSLTIAELALCMFREHKREWENANFLQFAEELRPRPVSGRGSAAFVQSEAFGLLKKLRKVKFVVKHRGKMQEEKIYTIHHIVFDEKFGKDGATSETVTFNKKLPNGDTQETSVWKHYKENYNIRLQYPRLPLIETTRGAFFPLELCNIAPFQRYPFKLDPNQTASMIRFAVTRPKERKSDIMAGFQQLDYPNDRYLAEFGVRVSSNMQVTNARLLKNPEIAFAGNAKLDPGVSGRWDLRGKRFLEPNQKRILSWGLVVCGGACTQQEAEAFASKFTQTYRNHGANIGAPIHIINEPVSQDYGEICKSAWTRVGNHFKDYPQMIFFVVPNKNSLVYERIKKSMDCRFNCPSQVMQAGHVKKANAQYMSNVAMKVNAKLGGVTCKVAAPGQASPFFTGPTMIIGVDVSHAAPGSGAPSMAAMTVSIDKNATRYAAACETNGWREEILQSTTCHDMFPPMLRYWIGIHKTPPKQVYYFRDGVDEGSFEEVIKTELGEIRRIFREQNAGNPKITAIIATKRHHIRFFPKSGVPNTGDRNGNPLPGTLVERDATHPHHFDFYLCSHVAIQGTARPVHYQVIYDDNKVLPNELQKMIYEQCYQYARSTTPVSLHPAVYYAHVASNRARAHENIHASRKENIGGKEGHPTAKHHSETYADQAKLTEPMKLVPMIGPSIPADRIAFMNSTMWYI